jgi:hypothetical protein
MAFEDITVTLRSIPLQWKVLDRANRISLFLWRGFDCVMPNRHLK